MRLKKILLISLLILSILLQTGCWSKTELTKLAIVTAIGIDINENREIEVSLQFVKVGEASSGQSKGGSPSQEKQYIVITSKGETVFEAVRNLLNSVDRKVVYSNMKVIILGEKLAKEGITQILDVFERQTQTPPTAKVLVADGISVKDILETESKFEKIPAVGLSNIEDNFNIRSNIFEETLIELLQDIRTVGKDVVLGGTYKNKNKEIVVEGCAVFKGDRLIGWLEDELTRGFRFIKGDIQNGTQKLKSPSDNKTIISLETVNAKSKLKIEWVDGTPKFIIDIQQSGSIAEINYPLSLNQKDKIDVLEQEFTRSTKANVSKIINYIRENKSDILGLGNVLYKFHYKYWKQISNDWRNELCKVSIEVNVHSTIERTGFAN